MVFWVREHMPTLEPALTALFRKYTPRDAYQAPLMVNVGRRDWAAANITMKALLWDDSFWTAVLEMSPSFTVSFAVGQSRVTQTVDNPFHKYITLFCSLAKQLIHRQPQGILSRDAQCLELHQLFCGIGMPYRRFTVAYHYFCHHFTGLLFSSAFYLSWFESLLAKSTCVF
jgi:hypothetical protein